MDEVEEIKRRIDIVEFISTYLTVKKAGANFRALCPFHNEKTPSMMISPEKQIFKCFGCGEGGDVFSFMMKMENLEFPEAIKMLAERAGVKLQPRKGTRATDEGPDRKTRLFQINKFAAAVYHKILMTHSTGKLALDYLKKRGLTEATIKDFMIGYAPSSRAMTGFLKKRGFTDTEIQNAGAPDRFYRRIIFPISDVMGNVLGFTGRVMEKDVQPKYLNTPETIIFHKGRILYNLTRARGEIKLNNTTVLVEGQMDVISSYQAGVKNVVATSGTALTPDHLLILYRYTPNIIFAFDSDNAGVVTAKKAQIAAIEQGFNVKMLELGEFKDPGEMIEKDPILWAKAVGAAVPVVDWYFEEAFKNVDKDNLTSVQKKEIAKEVIPIIKKIPDSIEQAHYVENLSRRLGVPDNIIFDSLSKVPKDNTKREPVQKEEALTTEELLLGYIVKYAPQDQALEKLNPRDFSKLLMQTIYTEVKNWYNTSKEQKIDSFLKQKLTKSDYDELELIILGLENVYSGKNDEFFHDLVKRVLEKKKDDVKERYALEIAKAEKNNDRAKLKQLIKEFQDEISR